MEFVWAVFAAIAVVFGIHFAKQAWDCQQIGGYTVQTTMPFKYVCVPVRN